MRVSSVTLAFLFLSTVLATPIYPIRGDTAASLEKRGKQTSSSSAKASTAKTPSTAAKSKGAGQPKTAKGSGQTKGASRTICKRSPASELVKAIRSVEPTELGEGKFGKTYHITGKFQGQDAVVKIVKTNEAGPDMVIQEVVHLKQVHQFLAWGRREPAEGMEGLDYIVMPFMGLNYDKVPGLTKTHAEELLTEAKTRYETVDKMTHTDAHLGNALYKKKPDGSFECHLVDWLWAENGQTHHGNPGTPLTITLADCVFDPWATNSDSEHSTTGSSGYKGDVSSKGSQGSHGSPGSQR